MKKSQVLLVAALALVAAPAFSATIELQQGANGYTGTQDCHIVSWDGNQNQLVRLADGKNGGNGGATATTGGHPQNTGGHVFIEEGDYGTDYPLYDDSKCILIKFDMTSVPKNFSSAKIGLYYWYERSTGSDATEGSGTKKNPHTLNVFRVLKKWEQGKGGASSGVDGDDAADNSGVVTWNSTGFELWQAMGAEGPADIAPPDSQTYFDPAKTGWVWFDVTPSARIWVADPSKNNGVKISQEMYPYAAKEPDLTLASGAKVYKGHPTGSPTGFVGGAYNFISSENSRAALRPKMVVEGASDAGNWELFR